MSNLYNLLGDDEDEPEREQDLPVVDIMADMRSPDEAAAERVIADEVGQPPQAVRAYPELFGRSAEVSRTRRETQTTPRLQQWLADQSNFAVARDDVENLSVFERARASHLRGDHFRALGPAGDFLAPLALPLDPMGASAHIRRRQAEGSRDPFGNEQQRQGDLDVEQSMLGYRRGEMEAGGADLSPEDLARLDELAVRPGRDDWGPFIIGPTRRLIPQLVGQFRQGGEAAGAGYSDVMDRAIFNDHAGPETREAIERGEPGAVTGALARSAAASPLAAIVGAGHGLAGFYSFGFEMETGSVYDEMRRSGIEAEIAWPRAQEYGAWATALEFAGDALGAKLSGAGRLAARTFLRRSALQASNPALRAAGGVAGGAVAEGPTEAAQQLAQIIHQDLAQQESANGDADVGAAWRAALTPESIEQILHAGYIGAQGGGGMAVVPASVNYGLDIRAAQRAEQNAATFEEWTRAAQASKLNERGLTSTLESAVGAMDDSNVYIDADQFLEHFQGANANPYTVADELGIGAENLAQAVASHGLVHMPTATFAARVLRLPEHAKLAEHARILPTDMTPAEAKMADAVFKAEVEALAAEVETAESDNEIGAIVETRMRELFAAAAEEGGPRSAVSARYAKLVAAMPRALLARARATNPEYAARLEGQLRTLFGKDLNIAGPARAEAEGGAGLEQGGRGRSPERGTATFSDPRLTARENKIVEMATNNFSNAEIAEEMEIAASTVSAVLTQASAKLGGAVWEQGRAIGRVSQDTAPTEEIIALRDKLIGQGFRNYVGRAPMGAEQLNDVLLQRLHARGYESLTANSLKVRISKYEKKKREQGQTSARREPFDLHTPKGRAEWFASEVLAEPIPGEASDARQYGFALDNGDVMVMSIAPEPQGTATVEWTFQDRQKAIATDPDVNPFTQERGRLGNRGALNLMARLAAILEADMAAFKRDAYVYTPYTRGIEAVNKRLVNRIIGNVPYSTTEDGIGAHYIVRDGAEVLRDGSVLPSPENENAEPINWPQVDPAEVEALQAGFHERLERFAKSGAVEGDGGDGGRAGDVRGGDGVRGRVSGTGGSGTGELEQPGRNDGIGPGGLPIRPREPGRQSFVGGSEDLVEAARMGYRGQDTGEAAEWIRARDKGLPMDEASRMARAREMGFDVDTPLYHGTDQDIAAFRANEGWYGAGVSLSRAPAKAEPYTRRTAQQAIGGDGEPAPNIMPVFARGRLAPLEEFEAVNRQLGHRLKMTTPEVQAELQRRGYDGVNVGSFDDEILIFDPANIRSKSAAFDPDYRDSADLLAQDEAGQGGARGSIRYHAFKAGEFGEAVIRLGEASDLSTFLHEFGHLGHLILESIATDPQAPAEFKAMWENTLQWWGVTQDEWSALTPEAKVEYFERWARTFEAYLMEGKAPSLGLREAFAAFKQWLIQIYRSVLRLDHNLNPEIRDVFDRLLATDAEMAEARAAQGADFALAREAFATDEEFQQYQQAIAEARDAQEAELRARVMDAHARKSKRWWRGERERMRPAAARHVDSDPARRAEQWLGSGEWRPLPETTLSDEGETGYVAPADAMEEMPEGLPEMRLSAEALAADWPDAQLPPAVAPRTDVETVLAEAMKLKAVSKGRGPARAARLWLFIKDNGGINLSGLSEEQRATFMEALGSGRKRPGVINKDGKTPEELMALAADAGYFGKGAARTLRQPPVIAPIFHSAVERALERSTTARSSGSQWWSTLSKAQGVKREELEWIGLEDFLAAQEGPVSREEVLAFVRENGVRVEETVLGGEASEESAAIQRKVLPLIEERGRLLVERDALQQQLKDHRHTGTEEGRANLEALRQRGNVIADRLNELVPQIDALNERHRELSAGARTRWSQYALPGGENYRELLLRLPESPREPALYAPVQNRGGEWEIAKNTDNSGSRMGPYPTREAAQAVADTQNARFPETRTSSADFRTSHFDQPNVLAHVRFNERTDAEGRRTLFIEELQSDWHQGGRERGYKTHEFMVGSPVPDAPFKNNAWAALALKRMIRWAAENGFDQIAWTRGQHQIERFNLAQHITRITSKREADGRARVYFGRDVGRGIANRGLGEYDHANNTVLMTREQALEVMGKDIGGRVFDEAGRREAKEFTGTDLEIGGEGMRAFYDRILPNIANDLGKKFGARVGETQVGVEPAAGSGQSRILPKDEPQFESVHSLPITPQMRESVVSEGQTLFQPGELFSDKAPRLEEFMSALIADLKNERQVFSAKDPEALASAQALADAQAWFDANEIDLTKSKEEIRGQIVAALERGRSDPNAVHPDTAAEFFGFSSGDHLIQALSALKPRAVAIEDRIDSMVEEEHGDAASPDKIQEAARLAAHVEAQSLRIELELAALQKATGGRARPVGRAARKYAEQQVSRMSVREVRGYEKFLAGERRAARNASEAKNPNDAAMWKQRQLISFHLYRFARDAAEEMDKSQSYFRKFDRDTIRANIHPPLLDQIDQTLEGIDLRRTPRISNRRRQNFLAWYSEMQAEGLDHMVAVDPGFLAEVKNRPFASLTVEEARGLRDAIKNFEHIGRRWREVLSSRGKRLMEEAVTEMVAAIDANGQIISEKRKGFSPDTVEYLNEQRLRFHAEHTKPEFLFRLLDGLKDSGPVWRNLFAPIARAEDAEMEMRNAAAARMTQVFSAYSRAERGRLFVKKRFITAIGRSMTKAEILSVALNWGNEGNRQALVEGYQWNDQQVRSILDELDQRDWQVVKDIWAWLEEYREPSFALQERLTGVRPVAVEGMEVATNFGPVQGAYYPLRYDPEQGERAFRREEQSKTLEEWGSNWIRPQTRQGHLQARVGSGGQKVRLDLSVLTEHVENVIHDITHRFAVIGTLRFIENKRLQEAMIAAVGRQQYRQLRPWLSRIAADVKDPSTVWERVLLRLRMGASVVNMGWKITTAIVQPLGLLNSLPRVGGGALAKALVNFYAQPHKMREAIGFVFERSTFMKNRMATFDRDVRDALNRIRGKAERDVIPVGVRQSFFWMTGVMDMSVSVPTWLAAYDNAMSGKADNIAANDERDAAEHADSVVRTTQGAGGVKDLTGYTGSKREIMRLFTLFYSYMSNLYNQLYVEQAGGLSGGIVPPHVFIGNMFVLWFLPAVGAVMLQGRWEPDDDETDEERLTRIGLEVAAYPLFTMVGVRDIVNGVITPYDYTMTPVSEALERTVGAGRRVVGAIDNDGAIDEDELRGILKDMTLATGYWLGIPARQLWITGEYLTDVATGEEAPPWEDPEAAYEEGLLRDRR